MTRSAESASPTLSTLQGIPATPAQVLAFEQAQAEKKNGNGHDKAGGIAQFPVKVVSVGVHEFMAKELPVRDTILSPWLLSQSLNMIYAWRSVGKTHVSLGIAYAIASGGEFLGWKADKPRPVLYVDGEMPGIGLQERIGKIVERNTEEPPPGFLNIITPDMQPNFNPIPDLSSLAGQMALDDVIASIEKEIGQKIEVIILDNLSCLVRAGKENESQSWDDVQGWALQKRARGTSIIFIHHSGKSGEQRGTSKREDVLDTSIKLKWPSDYSGEAGAWFEIHFVKSRNCHGPDVAPREVKLETGPDGKQFWSVSNLVETTYSRVVNLAGDGLSQTEIATELGVNRSTVCRAWRKAVEAGAIDEAVARCAPLARATRNKTAGSVQQ